MVGSNPTDTTINLIINLKMANRGRHRKRHVKCILHVSRYSESWISKVLDDETIDRILNHQFNQSGIRDLKIFEHQYAAGSTMKGFTWMNTPEGQDYWEKTMTQIHDYKIKHDL